jgi:hypothetical protein
MEFFILSPLYRHKHQDRASALPCIINTLYPINYEMNCAILYEVQKGNGSFLSLFDWPEQALAKENKREFEMILLIKIIASSSGLLSDQTYITPMNARQNVWR